MRTLLALLALAPAGVSAFAATPLSRGVPTLPAQHSLPKASLATTAAPALGAAIANVMFFSGLPEVVQKRREGSLGDFNPMPMPIILGNTFGWLTYSILTKNVFVAAANAPGFLLASWYVMTVVRLADASASKRIETVAMAMAAVHTCAGLACAFLLPTRAACVALYGAVCNAILLAYYAAPLSTIGAVLRQRSASSIYLPTVLINGINGLFWSIYALAISDVYILIPNAIGAALASAQVALCAIFGSKPAPTEGAEEADAAVGVVEPVEPVEPAAVPA